MVFTIVTCLYDIRRQEEATPCNNNINTLKDYLELSRPMLAVRLPMVIYTDEEPIVEHVYKCRLEYGLLDKTWIVRLPFQDTFFYKDLDMLQRRMKEFPILNQNPRKDTALYVLLNNNKFDFLSRTLQSNPFQTDFFLWMDIGIQHCTKATPEEWQQVWETWPSFVQQDKEHIHQLPIHHVKKPKEMAWKEYFQYIYHHMAGGLFGGHRDCLWEYIHLFQEKWHNILHQEGWWQLDEAIMTMIAETFPEKFRFFYGNYDGILANFIHTQKSFSLVFQVIEHYMDTGHLELARTVFNTIRIEKCTPEERDIYQSWKERLFQR